MTFKSSRKPKAGPGQTLMYCPTNRRYTIWRFTDDDALVCMECSMKVTRKAATGA